MGRGTAPTADAAHAMNLPRCGGRGLGDALGFEPALGVDGGLAAVGCGGDGLAVSMVVDVAGDEDALDLRVGLVVDDEVALLVDVEPVAEGLGVRPIADGDEQAIDRAGGAPRRSRCRSGAARRPCCRP